MDGISAINTIRSVIGVDLDTLRPMPTVEGFTTPGGYSCKAIKPIALRMTMEVAVLEVRKLAGVAPLTLIVGVEHFTFGTVFHTGGAAQTVAH